MLNKNLKQIEPGADFIVFLNQEFCDSKKIVIKPTGKTIKQVTQKNKPIKPAKKTNKDTQDENVLSILRATVPPKKSRLNIVLKEYFPEPYENIEERIVMGWLKKAMYIVCLFMDDITLRVKPKKKKGRTRSRLYSFIFSVSEKSNRAKLETEEKLITRPWVAKLVVSGIVALFISITLVRLTPGFAFKIIGFCDRIVVYPIMKIVQETSPSLRNYDFFSERAINQVRKPITKEMLSGYIVKNELLLKNKGTLTTDAVKITEEELRGRVAGVSTVAESTHIDLEKYYNSYISSKALDSGSVYDFLQSFLDNLADKQGQISEDLSNKLVDFINAKFRLDN